MVYWVIELVRDELICSRFRSRGGRIDFVDSLRAASDHEEERLACLKEVAASRREDDQVILAVDPALFSCREVALPLSDRRKLREILPLELRGETLCDTDDLVFDSIIRNDGTQWAIWGRKRELAARIGLLTTVGLDPQVVTAGQLHWQSILPTEGREGNLLVGDRTGAVLFRQGEPVLFRSFRDEDPAQELRKTLAALEIADGITVEQVWHLGGADAAGEGESTPLPVSPELADAFGGDGETARQRAGSYALALACRKKEILNFRQGDLGFSAAPGAFRKKFVLPATLAGILFLILFSDLGLRYYFISQDLSSLNTSIRNIYREIFPSRKKPVDEVGEVKSEIRRLTGAGAGIYALSVLKRLAEIKGDDILGFFETEIDGNQVKLRGDAPSMQAVTGLKNRAGMVLDGVEVGETSSKPNGSVTFSLRGTIKEEAK